MLSFIVIGKNEGWRLQKCLQSVRNVVQCDHIADWELIYVDSQSSDSSIEYAKQAGALVFLITGVCNAAIARNIGAKEAKGDILFFIDGDMEILPGFLPCVLEDEKTLRYPFVSGIFNDIQHDKDWNYVSTTRRHALKEGDPDAVEITTGGLFLITHDLWNRVGGMDVRFRRSQDYDLGLRLAGQGVPLHRKSVVLANHYMQQYAIRQDYIPNVKYTALLLRKHWRGTYLRIFVRQQYTTIILLLAVLLSFITPYFLLLYLFAVICKIAGQHLNWKQWYTPVARDVYLIGALFFFWETPPEVKYVGK